MKNNIHLEAISRAALSFFLFCLLFFMFLIAESLTGHDLEVLLYIGVVSITLYTSLKN